MKVNETFLSLQGEGPQTGLLTFFIRFSGCNLRCGYCDTKYAYNEGVEQTVGSIVQNAKLSGTKKICITGGEPLLQDGLDILAEQLISDGFEIDLETNGSLPLPEWTDHENVVIALDIKCPSSGMADKMLLKNLRRLKGKDFVKFVIGSQEDYEFAKEVSKKVPEARVYFHPVFGDFGPKDLAERIISDKLTNTTLGLQIHKIIWSPDTRAV
jgi:7-carboxy-7-deazaguanine synthase